MPQLPAEAKRYPTFFLARIWHPGFRCSSRLTSRFLSFVFFFEPVAFPPPKKISFISISTVLCVTHVLFSRNIISQPSEMALPVLLSESTRLKVTRLPLSFGT